VRLKKSSCLAALIALLSIDVASALAGGIEVAPESLNLTLDRGQTLLKRVSLTIPWVCIRPYDIDVVASERDAQVDNLTGRLLNGCSETSNFEVEFRGSGTAQTFELEFIDYFGGSRSLVGSIPVTINVSGSAAPRNGANMPNPMRSCQNTTCRWC
jgi:hypothetical protein